MGNDINLDGYHGCLERNAASIQKVQKFTHSNKVDEWLGEGAYFFEKREYAVWWAQQETRKRKNEKASVIIVKISCDEQDYMDLDKPEQMRLLEDSLQSLLQNGKLSYEFKDDNQLRCFSCNYFLELHSNIKVLSYSFFHGLKSNEFGFRNPIIRKQHCVKDDMCVKIVTVEVV